jgi:hypothetical protein
MYDVILFHVYRSVNTEPDMEGYLGGLCLATLIANLKLETNEKFNPPIIVFGADLREISDGVPLFEIYKRDFVNHALALGLSPNDFKLFQPDNFSETPVGTKTELELFNSVIKTFGKEEGRNLVFCREPHLDRVKYLTKVIGIEPEFETHEGVIWSIMQDQPEKYYNDRKSFRIAEKIKMLFMRYFDRSGDFLEDFSRVAPEVKNALLTALGHRN